jgi:HSP20 family protein
MLRERRPALRLLGREFDRLLDRLFEPWPLTGLEEMDLPVWDVAMEDAGKELVVRMEAPGFEAREFEVEVVDDTLTVRVVREEKKEKEEKEEKEREEKVVRLFRSILLPAGIDKEKVEARYRNGILEIHLPKLPEALGRRIEVKV